IVSYKPAVLLDGSQTILAPSFDKIPIKEKVAVALAGRVLCKVTTENGPIEAGDLLVSSSLEGHAMKAGKYEQSFGTIFAKALEDFNGDKNGEQTGAIKVLITVQ
ncbi:MAG: hypothetical protein KC618_05865, partial [Candidatus Omnitrophica bacterium]|nr:hypothetical protein [Candidatus Omnitrophota bacterium]